MKVNVICPSCHKNMVYQGGNVTVYFGDNEDGELHETDIVHCDKCGVNIGTFSLKIETEKINTQ